jgi:hypothetical protein
MKQNKHILKLIVSTVFVGVASLLFGSVAFANSGCKETYGGGETCLVNKRFKIEKKVRIGDSGDWKDKVTKVEEDDEIQFKIKIKNLSDEEADDFDDMKMEDKLPSELTRTGGDGLTEYWEDFAPGEEKTFIIKAKVKDSEFDRDEDFEKCVVNKAQVKWDDETEGSSTATVCYGNAEPKELPKTGAVDFMAIAGAGFTALGLALKKLNK